MRNKILILIPIMLLALALAGCIPGITPTPEPEEPAPEMEAVALAELDDAGETILWSIVNTGDVFIREYILTFKVEYPDIAKDCIIIELKGTYLEVGDMHSGDIELVSYGEEKPKSVSVTWELFE